MQAKTILFVCLGNICRSPLGEGVFRAVVEERGLGRGFRLDSAGTGGWHAGEQPDRRSIAVAARHGIDISGQRARQILPEDFSRFDLILVDATLPDMPSDQLVDKLKTFPHLQNTPIIIVSYKNSEAERKRFARCHCDGFLSKVASPNELGEILGKALNRAA